jgi:chromosomal replication initiation ATPase DnaA
MFAVSASRTMANAKPKFREPEPVFDWLAERRRQQEADRKAAQERQARQRADDEAVRRELAEMMRRANAAAKQARSIPDRKPMSPVGFEQIVRRICKATGFTREQIASNDRHRPLAEARQAIFYWTRRLTDYSYPEIGRRLGGFDHTTALHAVRVYPQKRAKKGRTLKVIA